MQVTNDNGKTWKNVTVNVPGLPKNTWCSKVAASNFDANTSYVVFDGHRNGDKNVYVYKTTDLGETWISLAADNIETFARTILEDYVNPNLLFLGTEYGLYITIDGGKQWVRFKGKVPKVPIYEMAIQQRENDLVLGTHGRGVLIIDNITPLRQLTDKVLSSDVAIFPSKPYIITNPKFAYGISGDQEYFGQNPSSAALITYYLKKRHIFGDMSIEIYNSDDFEVEIKSDNSPLTKADRLSHQIIKEGLTKSFPQIPVLSEEGKEIPYEERKYWDKFWLVDPLDGTKEFIKRNGEFTVNIALIENGKPVFGLIYVPVTGETFFGDVENGSYKIGNDHKAKRIFVSNKSPEIGRASCRERV